MIPLPPAAAPLIVGLALLLLLLIALAPLYRHEEQGSDEARVRACAYDLANNPHAHCWCGQH